MRPTEILMNEHRVIEQVLDCVEAMADGGRTDGRIDGESARQAVDFLRTFADRCHHGKEEEQLFPMMESRGFSPNEGPTAVMRQEHVIGRSLIAQMDGSIDGASNGDATEVQTFVDGASKYVALLREHIMKEDHCLFPMADQAFAEADDRALLDKFDRVEHEEIGSGVHERYTALANELAERFGVERRAAAQGGCGCSGHMAAELRKGTVEGG